MKQFSHTLITLFAFFCIQSTDAQAQVVVGSTDAAESFSILQIDGVEGGLRLPQLTTAQVATLKTNLNALAVAERQAVAGLIVFNIQSNKIEYWDGDDWATISDKVTIENGITRTSTQVELGGLLKEATAININDKKLGFEGGKWNVNNTVFEIEGQNVTIKPSVLAIYDTTLSTDASGNVKANGTFTVSNAGNTLTIDNNVVKIEGQLRYNNAKKADGKVLMAGALTGGKSKAYWGTLKPDNIRVETGVKLGGTAIPKDVLTVLSSQPLHLEAGRWLVFAKTIARTTHATNRMHLWLKLAREDAPTNFICVTGGDVESSGYTSPQFTYFLVVDEPGNYIMSASTSNLDMSLIDDPNYGSSYFYAILIDKPESED